MTSVLLERSKAGLLLACSAEGHSGYAAAGSDIVCSAVTVLLRTTMQVLSETAGAELSVSAATRGSLGFCVKIINPCPLIEQRLVYAGDFLETGLKAVSKEFPQCLEIRNKTV